MTNLRGGSVPWWSRPVRPFVRGAVFNIRMHCDDEARPRLCDEEIELATAWLDSIGLTDEEREELAYLRRWDDPEFVPPEIQAEVIESESLPEETLMWAGISGERRAAALRRLLPAWEGRHGEHPWYPRPVSILPQRPPSIPAASRGRAPRTRPRRTRRARARAPSRLDDPDEGEPPLGGRLLARLLDALRKSGALARLGEDEAA